ncbi:hypothetical protein AND_009536 [Anopheles darlingi]|uniref:Uncharacterized protein n=1 Tax=Anopheles darlingi TaxID=43151 RepID=W5J637_ANODA|nr:hypothetical protein AND_009536 [Anopheles darlingi]
MMASNARARLRLIRALHTGHGTCAIETALKPTRGRCRERFVASFFSFFPLFLHPCRGRSLTCIRITVIQKALSMMSSTDDGSDNQSA